MGQLEWRDTHKTTCLNLLYHPEFVYQILSQSHEDYQSYSILHFWLVGWMVGWLVDMSRYFFNCILAVKDTLRSVCFKFYPNPPINKVFMAV